MRTADDGDGGGGETVSARARQERIFDGLFFRFDDGALCGKDDASFIATVLDMRRILPRPIAQSAPVRYGALKSLLIGKERFRKNDACADADNSLGLPKPIWKGFGDAAARTVGSGKENSIGCVRGSYSLCNEIYGCLAKS